jgi:hypothetical protein
MQLHRAARALSLLPSFLATTAIAFAQIYPYAGTGVAGSAGIGGDSHQLQLNNPVGLASDGANGYIADFGNNRVVRVAHSSFTATVYAGNGEGASTGDGGPASMASLNAPVGLAMDENQNLYISEYLGHRIRKVDFSTGTISTIAGTGSSASSGDGGPATAAGVASPAGIAYDSGTLYVVEFGHSLRKIDLSTGIISTVAISGGGMLQTPMWATVTDYINGVKYVLVSDMGSHQVLRIDPNTGNIYLFAGNGGTSFSGDGVQAVSTSLGSSSLTIYNDQVGGLYIADVSQDRIRRVDRDTGIIETVAGNGFGQPLTTGGPATSSPLQAPQFIMAGSNGFTLFSDSNHRVWQLVMPSPYSHPYTATTASANPASPSTGQSMTLSATVAPIGTATFPTGSVTFQDPLGDVIGTAALSGGSATLPTNAPSSAGTYTVTASYSGDSSFYASISPGLQVVVVNGNKTSTVTTMALGQNPCPVNIQAGMFVTVVPYYGGAGPTGTVQVMEGGTVLGTATLQNGSATVWVTFSSTGTHTLTAVYSGDGNYLGSTSAPVSQQVKNMATGYITTSLNPATAGAVVTFTATVYQSGATGSIQFSDHPSPGANGVGIGTVPLVNGQAVFTTSSLSVGTHLITADYLGDAIYVSFSTSYITEVVNQIGTATTLTSLQNPIASGVLSTFQVVVSPATSASVQPTGTVQLLDGSSVIATAPVQSGAMNMQATFSTTGTHTITGVYSGDSNYLGSTSAAVSEKVKTMATGTIASSLNPSGTGVAIAFTARVNQAAATGSVQFNDRPSPSGNPVTIATVPLTNGQAVFTTSSLAVGTHLITAAYTGDATYLGFETSYISQVVNQSGTATTLTSSQNPVTPGTQVAFQVAVTPSVSTSLQPSGTVQLLEGSSVLTSASLTNGSAQLAYAFTAAGSHSLTAAYAGDANFQGSTSAVLIESVKATTTTSLSANNTSITVGQAVQLSASVTPAAAGGTVQFLDGGTVVGTAAVSGGVATISISTLAAGTHSITATYSGDGGDSASTSSAVGITVAKLAVSVSAASSLTPSVSGQSVTFTATVSPAGATGTVQFLDGATVLGTAALSGGSAALTTASLSAGSHSITTTYSGDPTYTGGSGVVAQMVKAITSIVVTSNNANAVFGQSVQFTATVAPATATGSVQFKDGSTVLATVALSGGAAVYGTSSLGMGTHAITAVYGGDALDVASTSAAYSQTISPGAPSNLTATTQSNTQINLAWTASPTTGVTYNVYASTTPGFTPSAANRTAAGVTHTNFDAKGLLHGTTYYFVVTAQSAGGESAPSNQASGATRN